MDFSIDPKTVDEIIAKIAAADDEPTLEVIRVAELGRRGRITTIARLMGSIPPEQRRHHGTRINEIKDRVEAAITERRSQLKNMRLDAINAQADITLAPVTSIATGTVSYPVDVTLPVREPPTETG